MFQDEAHFGRISDVRRCWAPKPLRPICQAMLTHEYTYVYGAVEVCTGELDSLILPHVNTDCMQLFINEVSARHPDDHIVMVIDGAGWHRSDGLKAPAVDGYQNPRDSGFLRDKPSKSSQPELDLEKSFRSGSVAELFTAQ